MVEHLEASLKLRISFLSRSFMCCLYPRCKTLWFQSHGCLERALDGQRWGDGRMSIVWSVWLRWSAREHDGGGYTSSTQRCVPLALAYRFSAFGGKKRTTSPSLSLFLPGLSHKLSSIRSEAKYSHITNPLPSSLTPSPPKSATLACPPRGADIPRVYATTTHGLLVRQG